MHRKTDEEPGRRAMDFQHDAVLNQFDLLTGLATREFYQSRIAEAWDQSVLEKTVMALMLVAVDEVERDVEISAEYSSKLKALAAVLSNACKRRSDFAARMRASEFAVYLAEVDAEGSRIQGEAICRSIRESTGISVSVGVACFVPTSTRFVRSLYQYADGALNKARMAGGSSVHVVTEADF